jgi:hypothetical protein
MTLIIVSPHAQARGDMLALTRQEASHAHSLHQGLPDEWHETMPDALAVFRVSGQIPGKKALFIEEPP